MLSARSTWSFDVSALMVLIGETEESRYRLMSHSLLECLSPCPVSGLQCYLRSYEWLSSQSDMTYFSPYGCKFAALRNMRLAYSIRKQGLLDAGKINTYQIRTSKRNDLCTSYRVIFLVWVMVSWGLFLSILCLLVYLPHVTWIGWVNCLCFSSWSMALRLFEKFSIYPRSRPRVSVPTELDAIFILGSSDSCFVLEGSREDIKKWTACELQFKGTAPHNSPYARRLAALGQNMVRLGSFMLLLLVFVTIPNGTTIDQVIFIFLNILGQTNVLICQELNAKCLFGSLVCRETLSVDCRTAVYAYLIRRFSDPKPGTKWPEAAGILPQTKVWRQWRKKVIEDRSAEPKVLYDALREEMKAA